MDHNNLVELNGTAWSGDRAAHRCILMDCERRRQKGKNEQNMAQFVSIILVLIIPSQSTRTGRVARTNTPSVNEQMTIFVFKPER